MRRNGFREKSKGERFEALEQQVEQLAQAVRISQMLIQQFMQSNRSMQSDLGRTVGVMNDLQYRLLAYQEVSGVDIEALKAKADELRLKDYNEASDKEDAEKGLIPADTVESVNDYVVISSTTPGEAQDKGIFRSKFRISESGIAELMTGLIGKKVGETLEVKLADLNHIVEVLAIRKDPAPLAVVPEIVDENA
jgi:sporulation protein YlmC with PRC-barrel domain